MAATAVHSGTLTRARKCEGKKQYRDMHTARVGIGRVIRATGAYPPQVFAYHCEFCKGYHVGHRPQGRWRKTKIGRFRGRR